MINKVNINLYNKSGRFTIEKKETPEATIKWAGAFGRNKIRTND
jgi:hypothetical protein